MPAIATQPATTLDEAREAAMWHLGQLEREDHRQLAKHTAELGKVQHAWRAAFPSRPFSGTVSRVANKPKFRQAVQALQHYRKLAAMPSPDELIAHCYAMATLDPALLVDDEGVALPLPMVPEHVRRAIQAVVVKTRTITRGKAEVRLTTTEYKLADKPKATDLLMRAGGMMAQDNLQRGVGTAAGLASLIEKMQQDNSIEPGD